MPVLFHVDAAGYFFFELIHMRYYAHLSAAALNGVDDLYSVRQSGRVKGAEALVDEHGFQPHAAALALHLLTAPRPAQGR